MELTIKNTTTGYEIPVPENCNVTVEENVVIFEPKKGESEPEFKEGDILYQSGCIIVFSGKYGNFTQNGINSSGELRLNLEMGFHNTETARYATPAEKQILFDALAKEGKAWDADKKQIVDLVYIPKAGDCVKRDIEDRTIWGEMDEFGDFGTCVVFNKEDGSTEIKNSWHCLDEKCNTQIAPDELQAEFNKIGYEYDFTTHTAKKIEWKPKYGEPYWSFRETGIFETYWDGGIADIKRMQQCIVFKTEELAQSAYDKVNELLNELPKE